MSYSLNSLKGGYIGDNMGGCQNYGPFLGTRNIRRRIIIGTQIGTIILTTTHIGDYYNGLYGALHVLQACAHSSLMWSHLGCNYKPGDNLGGPGTL